MLGRQGGGGDDDDDDFDAAGICFVLVLMLSLMRR